MRYIGKRSTLLDNEDGIALVTALMLGFFGMLMVAALLFMVKSGTWMSGSQQRKQTIVAAAHGANNFFMQEVIRRCLLDGATLSALGGYPRLRLGVVIPADKDQTTVDEDFANKLTTTGGVDDIALTGASDWPGDPDSRDIDIIFTTAQGIDIAARTGLVRTSKGNSQPGPGGGEGPDDDDLELPDPVSGRGKGGGGGEVPHFPHLFQVSLDGQNVNNRIEQVRFSSMYVF